MSIHSLAGSGRKSSEVRVRGHRLVYDLYGDGEAVVVLLHGIPGDRSTWSAVAPLLAEGFTVLVPDMAGYGESEGPRPAGHAEAQGEVVVALLDALGIRQAHLVGHDFGGPVAVAVLRIAPGRVLSLSLLATNILASTPVPPPLRLARVPLLGAAVFRMLFGRAGLTAMWFAAVRDRAAYPLADFRKVLRSDATVRSTREVLLASMRDLPGLYAPLEETLRTAAVPVLVLWGAGDPVFPLERGEATAAAAPHGRLEVLPGCGHFIPREKPQETAALITAFLPRRPESPGEAR